MSDPSLTHLLEEQRLAETWLLAPTRRIGMQWLDAEARAGSPVLNVRVKTLQNLAMDLAAPALQAQGRSILRGYGQEFLVEQLLAGLRDSPHSYLSQVVPSYGLIQTLTRALGDLRLAGIRAEDLEPRDFEVRAKGEEIRALLAGYEEELKARQLADAAAVLRLADDRVRQDESALPSGLLLLVPGDLEVRPLERDLLQAFPEACRINFDRPAPPPSEDHTDRARLASAQTPSAAPLYDGTAALLCAVGAVNEIREVLRRCAQGGIPFDQVEILHTDHATYVPLLYELTQSLVAEDRIPVTFEEGIPVGYSRPGRALAAWLDWQAEDLPQATLASMLQDRLLALPPGADDAYVCDQLASQLRTVAIGNSRAAYVEKLAQALKACERRLAHVRKVPAPDAPDEQEQEVHALERRMQALGLLRDLVRELLATTPGPDAAAATLLDCTLTFLSAHTRKANELDAYAAERLAKEVRALAEALQQADTSLDMRQRLQELLARLSVGGRGPRPGCLYVAPLLLGGHSGRPHTYVVGLDDSRFPGAGLQDPVLLDSERTPVGRRLQKDLPTAQTRLADKVRGFRDLLARLRGTVTLSHSCYDLADDRELFPSAVFLDAYRILHGRPDGTQEDLIRDLAPPASFAPSAESKCPSGTDWWLWRLSTGQTVRDLPDLVGRCFPHLGRGYKASRERASDRFTAYDGYVPDAGAALDPASPGGRILSASQLELFGRCPQAFFFQHVLGLAPPEAYEPDPHAWLDALERGRLLHSVFRAFYLHLTRAGESPDVDRHAALLDRIVDEHVAAAEQEMFPPAPRVLEREVRELRDSARVFLRSEAQHAAEARPVYLEASIGLEPLGEGTELDIRDAVPLTLPGGRTIHVRGRVDRVDQRADARTDHVIWDYKTGSGASYRASDPFDGGRRVQNILYARLVEARFRAIDRTNARVVACGYYFPSTRGYAERIAWPVEELAGGMAVVENLCRLMATGCFPASPAAEDYRHSEDWRPAFVHVDTTRIQAERKLANPENEMLQPLRTVRGYEPSEADDA